MWACYLSHANLRRATDWRSPLPSDLRSIRDNSPRRRPTHAQRHLPDRRRLQRGRAHRDDARRARARPSPVRACGSPTTAPRDATAELARRARRAGRAQRAGDRQGRRGHPGRARGARQDARAELAGETGARPCSCSATAISATRRAQLAALADAIRGGQADLAVAVSPRASGGGVGLALGFARWAIRRRCGLTHAGADLRPARARAGGAGATCCRSPTASAWRSG